MLISTDCVNFKHLARLESETPKLTMFAMNTGNGERYTVTDWNGFSCIFTSCLSVNRYMMYNAEFIDGSIVIRLDQHGGVESVPVGNFIIDLVYEE